ncbi:MAG: hypothetical protein G01um10148_210 [Parcubacteria group bacterium Gr01-1014_8]|nr:MAG: hypothetical protein G01um10148_210 [Parcubacteria group bacterium Gr01-1014_8]
MSDKSWKPDAQKLPTLSRDTAKKMIDDFPTIKSAYLAETSKEGGLILATELARGYLEDILNLPEKERNTWDSEITGLGNILWFWEHRHDPNQREPR